MIVSVGRAGGGAYDVALHQPDDFGAFKVSAPGLGRAELAAALDGAGTVDGDHAFIELAALKRLAGDRAADPGWLASLEGMLRYAREHGWTSSDGDAIRAHCET